MSSAWIEWASDSLCVTPAGKWVGGRAAHLPFLAGEEEGDATGLVSSATEQLGFRVPIQALPAGKHQGHGTRAVRW